MKIHEYQAKLIFERYGIAVPQRDVATTADEARLIAGKLGGKVIVKAQIHSGARAEIGGIKLVQTAEEAGKVAGDLLNRVIYTVQSGPVGLQVREVLIEETIEFGAQLYVGLCINENTMMTTLMVSDRGGSDIESVAETDPDAILRIDLNPSDSFPADMIMQCLNPIEQDVDTAKVVEIAERLHRLFVDNDCALAEINPLVITNRGEMCALDAKVVFDDNAHFKHSEWEQYYDLLNLGPIERSLAGTVGTVVWEEAGDTGVVACDQGAVLAVRDYIKPRGARISKGIHVPSNATFEQIIDVLTAVVSKSSIKTLFVYMVRDWSACTRDLQKLRPIPVAQLQGVQIIALFQGTESEEALRVLSVVDSRIICVRDLTEAKQVLESNSSLRTPILRSCS